MNDVAGGVLDILVKYMYGCADLDIGQNTDSILVAADKYQLTALVRKCEQHLIGKLTPENVVMALLLTDGINAPALKRAAIRYLWTNMATLRASGAIRRLCEEGSAELVADAMTFLLPA